MYAGLDTTLERAGRQLDEIRTSLKRAIEGRLDQPIRDQIVANTYVLLEATLESTLKRTLSAMIDEINDASIRVCDLRWSLFSLFANPQFESISSRARSGSLLERVYLLEALDSTDICILSNSFLPLDGRTIRKRHLDLVWRIFGFSGASLAEPRHQFTLETAADARNDIAHGEATPSEVAGRQPAETVLRYVDEVEVIILHVDKAAEDYLSSAGYRR